MAGDRRTPGRTNTGGEYAYLAASHTLLPSASADPQGSEHRDGLGSSAVSPCYAVSGGMKKYLPIFSSRSYFLTRRCFFTSVLRRDGPGVRAVVGLGRRPTSTGLVRSYQRATDPRTGNILKLRLGFLSGLPWELQQKNRDMLDNLADDGAPVLAPPHRQF